MSIQSEKQMIAEICNQAYKKGYYDALSLVKEHGFKKVNSIKKSVLDEAFEKMKKGWVIKVTY